MTHVEFDKLVKRVEKEAASRLWLYELKLRILALLGYGYITGILTTILVLLLLMWSLLLFVPELNVTASRVAFGLVSAYVLFRLARIFLIRFPPPGGMEVYPEQLPQLFEMVDRLQEEFRSPPVHHIVLTPEFNAAMMYRPRIGPFRKSRNYLILGLPLFFGLSQPEFTAVVAHELGHLSYEHGKFGAYIYRIRERWYRLMESFGQRKGGIGALFTWFFSWYAPYFGAYSFVEVRQREYEADRGAADVTHPNWAASALCRVSVIGRYVHEVFWPSIEEESYKSPEVTVLPFKSMSRKLPDGPGYTIAQGLTHECLLEDAGTTDTHPSLNERLRALEVEPSTDYLPSKDPRGKPRGI